MGDDQFFDDRHDPDAASAARTRAEAMGIPPALGRKRRVSDEAAGGARDTGTPVPARRERRADQKAGRQLEAAEEALEKARTEARENVDKYVRLAAELDNVRRRHRQEQADQLQHANAELLTQLLPVVDNFHRALEHAPAIEGDAGGQWVNGVTMVLRQLEEILAAAGVEVIDAVGEDFDPNVHQAVMAEASDDHEDGKVIGELQRGYRLHDRVLRPSMVKVSRRA